MWFFSGYQKDAGDDQSGFGNPALLGARLSLFERYHREGEDTSASAVIVSSDTDTAFRRGADWFPDSGWGIG